LTVSVVLDVEIGEQKLVIIGTRGWLEVHFLPVGDGVGWAGPWMWPSDGSRDGSR